MADPFGGAGKLANDRANYGRAVQLMDICNGAGASTLGVVTAN